MDIERVKKEIKKLIRKRSGVKIRFSSLKKYIDNFVEENEQSEFLLKCRYEKLEECLGSYVEVYGQLVDLASELEDETELEGIELDHCEFQESFFELQFLFKKELEQYKRNSSKIDEAETLQQTKMEEFNVDSNSYRPLSRRDSVVTNNETGASVNPKTCFTSQFTNQCLNSQPQFQLPQQLTSLGKSHSIKLPSISLPRFNGNLEKWLQFRDSFRIMVAGNPALSDLEKFYYLSGNLDGEAKGVIEEIEFCDDGFKLAWDALISRYDDKKSIINKHVRSFFNLKPVQRESKYELQQLLDDSLRNLRALENLGEKLSDVVIVYTIKERLDKETRKLWENEFKLNISPTWKEMVDFLQGRCRILAVLGDNSKQEIGVSSNHKRKESHSKTFVKYHKQVNRMCVEFVGRIILSQNVESF